jgi:hypothetical protein
MKTIRENRGLATFVCRVRCDNESKKVRIAKPIQPRRHVLRVVDQISVIVKGEKTSASYID